VDSHGSGKHYSAEKLAAPTRQERGVRGEIEGASSRGVAQLGTRARGMKRAHGQRSSNSRGGRSSVSTTAVDGRLLGCQKVPDEEFYPSPSPSQGWGDGWENTRGRSVQSTI
jgi:hypothetical protein